MSTPAAAAERCWYLPHHVEDQEREWWPHFDTREKALAELWDERRDAAGDFLTLFELVLTTDEQLLDILADHQPHLVTSAPKQDPDVCVHLVCDGCELAYGEEGEMVGVDQGLHLDPTGLNVCLDTDDWSESVDGKHYCPACPTPPEDPFITARRPGPNDVPLVGL